MRVVIFYGVGERKKASNLKRDFKQLHSDFGGFSECACAELVEEGE